MKMKRFILIQLLFIVTISFLDLTCAMAVGLGFYGDLPIQEGFADNTSKPKGHYNGDVEYRFDTDNDNRSLGFVLDTALARDALFNYRLNLGYGKWNWKKEAGGKLKLNAYTMDHTFGFGVYRNQFVRLWLGPQLRFAVANGDYIDSSGNKDRDWDYSYVGIGVGPVFGLNVNPGDRFTASLTIGYRFMRYYGEDDYKGNTSNYHESKYDSDEKQLFMNISFFFRLNDTF